MRGFAYFIKFLYNRNKKVCVNMAYSFQKLYCNIKKNYLLEEVGNLVKVKRFVTCNVLF